MPKIKLSLKGAHLPIPKIKTKKDVFSRIRIRKLNWITILAVLSYLNVLVIIPMLASKNKPFVHFHAKQGLVLMAFFALFVFSFFVPVLPWILGIYYIFCVFWGVIMVILGREHKLPLLGKIASVL